MATRGGPIYELTVDVGLESFDAARTLLQTAKEEHSLSAGVQDTHLFESPEGNSLVLQLRFDDDAALEEFLAGRAAALDTQLSSEIDTPIEHHARVLREEADPNLPSDSACLNCSTPLRGQYCGMCGQRASSRLISLWELVRDAFGDMFELDSRLWQTLIPLMIRPGKLTADYLQGRRARFMPPFRMYLVLSLLFFLVAFFDPREELAILFEDPSTESLQIEAGESEAAESPESTENPESSDDAAEDDLDIDGVTVSIGDREVEDASDCDDIDSEDMQDIPVWLQSRLTQARLKHICEQVSADKGESLVEKVLDNVPIALIILLPLMAFVLKVLYPLSRRYYVEHVLFFVHFHSFFFLILSLQIIWTRLIGTLAWSTAFAVIPVVLSSFYIPVYLFKAMRRVYGQGFLLTLLKYLLLVVSYVIGFMLMAAVAFAIAAFSI